jgi:energy-coupling factor transporter ATP-binding protein EcfA2
MGRITSITINQDFHTYKGNITGMNAHFLASEAKALQGYDVPALPPGTVLDIDAPLVFLVGPNGSGKSTLLKKLTGHVLHQKIRALNGPSPSYLTLIHKGKLPMVYEPYVAEQPNSIVSLGIYEKNEEKIIAARRSSGQHQWHELEQWIGEAHKNEGSRVYLFDQPEQDLDMINKRKLMTHLCALAQRNDVQCIVATHEESFLRPQQIMTKVVSLYDNPVRTYLVEDFSLQKYCS